MLDQRIHELQVLRGQLDSCIGCGCLSLQRCGMVNAGDKASARGAGAHFLLDKFEPVPSPPGQGKRMSGDEKAGG
jgi:MerR family transcriptional regulator, redox-sensitive transcriptional activator SoxR